MKLSEVIDKAVSAPTNNCGVTRVRNVTVTNGHNTVIKCNILYHPDLISNLISGMVDIYKNKTCDVMLAKVIINSDNIIDIEIRDRMLNIYINSNGISNSLCYPFIRVGPTFYNVSLRSALNALTA